MARKKITQARAERAMQQVAMACVLPDTSLGMDAVILITGWSAPTVYRRCKAGQFPRPIATGKWHGGAVLAHQAKAAAYVAEEAAETKAAA